VSGTGDRGFAIHFEGIFTNGSPSDRQLARIRRVFDTMQLPDWKIEATTDIHVNAQLGGTGLRISSPNLQGKRGVSVCLQAAQALEPLGFVAADSYALVVHVGVPNESLATLKVLAATLAAQEPSLDALAANPRRKDEKVFAALSGTIQSGYELTDQAEALVGSQVSLSERNLAVELSAANSFSGMLDALNVRDDTGRNHKVNYRSVVTRGAVEFREHVASLSRPEHVSEYAQLCVQLVDAAVAGEYVLPVAAARHTVFNGVIAQARREGERNPTEARRRVGDCTNLPDTPRVMAMYQHEAEDVSLRSLLPEDAGLELDGVENDSRSITPNAGR
jgi:hypothetical protein